MPTITARATANTSILVTAAGGAAGPWDTVALCPVGGSAAAPGPPALYLDGTLWVYLNGRQSVQPVPGVPGVAIAFIQLPPGTYEAQFRSAGGVVKAAPVTVPIPAGALPDVILTVRRGLVILVNGQTIVA